VDAEGWFGDLLGQMSDHARLKPLPPPTGFVGQLRHYQTTGFAWLAFLRQFGFGACLADDMGLGKTIQTIALLLHLRGANGKKRQPALLVCPTSVVSNWQHEVARFAPSLRVLIHHGTAREKENFTREARRHELVVTSYALLHRDEKLLSEVEWGEVILDEAQNIKNPDTRQAKAARKLRAAHRIALTGTPVENRLAELWSLFQFLNPGYLGSQEAFRANFARPIERMQAPDASRRLKSLVGPFILRRVKTDPNVIRDLPAKNEMKVFCTLTREQATLYEAVVRDSLRQIEESEGIQRRGLVLATMLKLKQVCNHPAHFLGDGPALADRSGKLNRLAEMLDEVRAVKERALIFTQFAEMGALLKPYLQDALGDEVLFLHGGTPAAARAKMVERFQSDSHGPTAFILSIKAGGTGLNLTRANHVFHFDRWWNPAVENQATDRAFRIGQTKNVQVYKFLCAGTMEERIDEMIERKLALAESIVGTSEAWITELSTEQLREIFTLREEALG
jgi:SNF2 family DNA or RNA helicase